MNSAPAYISPLTGKPESLATYSLVNLTVMRDNLRNGGGYGSDARKAQNLAAVEAEMENRA